MPPTLRMLFQHHSQGPLGLSSAAVGMASLAELRCPRRAPPLVTHLTVL